MCGDVYKETYTDIKQLKSVVPVSQSILLEKNKVIRVVGPTRIEVTRGCIRVLGINVCASQSIYINRYRSYAIKAITDSMIGLLIGEGGAIEYPSEGEEVIDLWENAAVDIIKEGKRIAVLGGVDSGKTSFSTLLSNIALEYNLKPAIIDADVGQCDLAPPGFIALKFMKSKTLWLREVRGDMVRFVGYTTPSNPIAMSRIMSAVIELINIAENNGSDLIIVNTDGWFGDLASIEYKTTLIKNTKPKSVVVLGTDACSTLSNMLKGSSAKVYCLPKPKVVRYRDREDRRELRKLNYSMYFKEARRVCLEVDTITLFGSCIFSGSPLSEESIQNLSKELGIKIIMASSYDDLIIIMVPDDIDVNNIKQMEGINIVKPSNARGLISAVVDDTLEERDIAVIDDFDPISKRICILTPYRGIVRGIVIGRIRVDEYWNDKGRVSRCPI